MKTFFASLGGAVIGSIVGLFLLFFVGMAFIQFAVNDALKSASGPETGQDDGNPIVLNLDLRYGYEDQAPTSGPEVLFGSATGFIDIVNKLEAAANDDQVKGLFVRASDYGLGSSRAEEYRDAFLKFQAADKFIVVHSQGFFSGSPSAYRAVAPADEIWMQPGTSLVSSGITVEALFFKDLFDELSITPEFEAFYEYKSAVNTFEEAGFTEPHRENYLQLAESLWETSLADIATDRSLPVETVRTFLEASPVSSDEMIAQNFATHSGWPEDARDAAWERVGGDAVHIDIGDYNAPSSEFGSPVIAIVGGQGAIVNGPSGGSLLQEGSGFASDTIAESLLDAGRDEDVEAVIFRVDSPGGSPSASDQIWRAVQRIQEEEGKPVIVSMASSAASGGYYVATGADWIVANRSTITGSIGIFGGKFAIEEAMQRIGVNAETIKVGGPFTGAFTTTEPFSEEQRVRFRDYLKQGYDRFTTLVGEGRNLTPEQVDAVARGRVWTGAEAIDIGLVDELGGMATAISKARELAEIDPESDVRLVTYPMNSGGFAFLGASSGATAQELKALGQLTAVLNDPDVQALMSELEAARGPQVQMRMPSLIER